MRIAIVHGYLLGASASDVYVRELAREMKAAGHDVTLVTQEPDAEGVPFVDEAYDLDESDLEVIERFRRPSADGGSCRHVRPHLGGVMLSHERTAYEGYASIGFSDASAGQLQDHLDRTGKALHTVFTRWPQDFVIVDHLAPLPYVTARVLGGRTPYAVLVHSADLRESVPADRRLVPAALEGMRYAAAIVATDPASRVDLVSFAASNGMDVSGKARVIPPGVDTASFRPVSGRPAAVPELPEVDPADDIVAFVGSLRWTKGLQHALTAMPMIWQRRPSATLLVAGDGPDRGVLEGMARAMDAGDLDLLQRLVEVPDIPEGTLGYGPLLPDFGGYVSEQSYRERSLHALERIRFLGALGRDETHALLAAADVVVAPSLRPESFPLAAAEAVSSGALIVAAYHSGLREPVDALVEELGYEGFRMLVPGVGMTFGLADLVPAVLERYPTKGPGFRRRLHDVAERRFSSGSTALAWMRVAESTLASVPV